MIPQPYLPFLLIRRFRVYQSVKTDKAAAIASCEIVWLTVASGTSRGLYTAATRLAAIAYNAKSVTVFLVWHAAVVAPVCLRFSKTRHDDRVLSNRR